MERQVWIGLVGVIPVPGGGALRKGKGAFVNALAPAADQLEFENVVRDALSQLGFIAHEFEDVEAFSERTAKWEVDEELRVLAEEVASYGDVRFGAFHTYSSLE